MASSDQHAKNKGKKLQKKSKRKLDYSKNEGQVEPDRFQSTPNRSTLISLFAKAKAPSYVSCPVCSVKVEHGFINQHLDRGCLATADQGSILSRQGRPVEGTSSAWKDRDPLNDERQVAALKVGVGDRRIRERLSRKYKSHSIYRLGEVTVITDDESSQDGSQRDMLGSRSWVSNKEDFDDGVVEAGTDMSCEALSVCVSSSDSDYDASDKSNLKLSSIKNVPNGTETLIISKGEHSKSSSLSSEERTSSARLETDTTKVRMVKSQDCSIILKERQKPESAHSLSQASLSTHKRLLSDFEEGSSSSQVTVSVNKKMKLHVTRRKLSTKRKCLEVQSNGEALDVMEETEKPVESSLHHHRNSNEDTPSKSLHQQMKNNEDVASPTGSQQSHNSSSTSSPHKPKEPYYVSNFKFILNKVLGNEDDVSLLSKEDLHTVSLFNDLSNEGQQLYIRIFQRKLAWIRVNKLQYPKIAEDLVPYATEICQKGLFRGAKDSLDSGQPTTRDPEIAEELRSYMQQRCARGVFLDESEMVDLEEVLRQLPAPDIKLLTKDLKVACPDGTQKADMVTACMKHCKKQKGLFGASLRPLMLKKAKRYLGSCIKLCQQHRAVFTRICLLFSPVLMTEDEENASGGQNQLQALLLVNFGRVIYPSYQINRTRKVFRNRDDLIRYEVALQYEHDIMGAMSTNDFDLAGDLWKAARATQQEILKDESIKKHTKSLPVFLQYFTALSVYEHIHYLGVEILQKQRRYPEAVEELKLNLSSCEFRKDSRGSRWDRLALNLDQHLKDPNQALNAILEGLADSHVKTGHRLSLEQRAEKILSSTSNKKLAKRREHEFNLNPITVKDLPTITIQGKILPYTGPGVKNVFIRSSGSALGEEETGFELCSVEQVAIDHYLQHGYTHGKHGEGTTFTTLIFLLFWEEIFMDIPDVFSYPYQSGPLDLRTDEFFSNREEALQKKLDALRAADEKTITSWLEETWLEHEGEACVGVNWDLLSLEEAKSLLGCMGGAFISSAAERLLRSHRHCRGGMPDLILWNTQTKIFKMSEVKGPGDRLSHKQILWIQFFQSIGSDAEVCHVQGLQSKNLKHRQLQVLKSSQGKSPRKAQTGTPKKSPSNSPHQKTPVKLKQKQT